MNDLKIYKELTYIICKDWEIFETPATLEQVEELFNKSDSYIKIGDVMIMKSDIKRIQRKKLSDVEQVIYSIEDKTIRKQVQEEMIDRIKKWMRVNVEIISNLVSKYQQDA